MLTEQAKGAAETTTNFKDSAARQAAFRESVVDFLRVVPIGKLQIAGGVAWYLGRVIAPLCVELRQRFRRRARILMNKAACVARFPLAQGVSVKKAAVFMDVKIQAGNVQRKERSFRSTQWARDKDETRNDCSPNSSGIPSGMRETCRPTEGSLSGTNSADRFRRKGCC